MRTRRTFFEMMPLKQRQAIMNAGGGTAPARDAVRVNSKEADFPRHCASHRASKGRAIEGGPERNGLESLLTLRAYLLR